MAQKFINRKRSGECQIGGCRVSIQSHAFGCHRDGYKPIRREVDEPGAKACSMNIPQSVSAAADKVMETDLTGVGMFMTAKLLFAQIRTAKRRRDRCIFPIKAEIPFREQTELYLPGYTPIR